MSALEQLSALVSDAERRASHMQDRMLAYVRSHGFYAEPIGEGDILISIPFSYANGDCDYETHRCSDFNDCRLALGY